MEKYYLVLCVVALASLTKTFINMFHNINRMNKAIIRNRQQQPGKK